MTTDNPCPRPSATVVLARNTTGMPEILMVRRHAKSSFGKAYAFPGGVVEDADSHVARRCRGMTAASADRLLGVARGGLSFYSAAARELFEESGILLTDAGVDIGELHAPRQALNSGELDWGDFLDQYGLSIDCSNLRYFSFWITPAGMPKRYSTRFFLAALPDGQVARHDGGELTDSRWMPAAAVLNAADAGEMTLHAPTRRTLEALAAHASLADMLTWAAACAESGVPCVRPALVERGERIRVALPDGDDYPLEGQ